MFNVKELPGITDPLGFFDPIGFTEGASEGKVSSSCLLPLGRVEQLR